MNLKAYLTRRRQGITLQPQYHERCYQCLRPERACYCSHITPFDPKMTFVILTHPIEFRRRIATGRMSHQSLEGSHLFVGVDFPENPIIQELVADPNFQSVVLYPGKNSQNLSLQTPSEKKKCFHSEKHLCVFVIDGTWRTARRMLRLNPAIRDLPQISFDPTGPSNFRVRKQPKENCLSTIEAIHHCIELLGETQGFDIQSRKHDNLLRAFDRMVELQLDFIKQSYAEGRVSRHKLPKAVQSL